MMISSLTLITKMLIGLVILQVEFKLKVTLDKQEDSYSLLEHIWQD
jgi:hypothetical protein